jgi:hypothetical protein
MAAAALIVVLALVISNLSSSSSEQPWRRMGRKTSEEKIGKSASASTDEIVTKRAPEPDAVKQEIEAYKEIQRKEEERKKEAARVKQLPYKKIESWRDHARKLIDDKKFEEALQMWQRWYDNATEKRVMDDKIEDRAVIFKEEHQKVIQEEIANLQARWKKSVEAEAQKIRQEALYLSDEHKFDEARARLKKYPPYWDNKFSEVVQKLRDMVNEIDREERRYKSIIAAQAKEKSKRAIEVGDWVAMVKGKEDFLGNWQVLGTCETEEDGKKWIVRLEGQGAYIYTRFTNMAKWQDYEVEFKIKSTAKVYVRTRFGPNAKKGIGFTLPAFSKWTKIGIKLEGVTVEFFKDGEPAGSDAVDVLSGGVQFYVREPGAIRLRDLKIKINKLSK